MRKILFLIIAVLVISSCSKSTGSSRIELKNLSFAETGNENHTVLISAFNGNSYLLSCNLIIKQDNITSKQNIGEFKAFEPRNISAAVVFPKGNSTIKFSTECSRT